MKKKILVIDGSPENHHKIRWILCQAVRLEFARTKEDAQQAWDTEKPDLILLDLDLENNESQTIISILESNHELKEIPLILMSTFDFQTDPEKAYQLVTYPKLIIKPFVPKELALRISKELNLSFNTILLIDGEPEGRTRLAKAIAAEGLNIFEAENCQDAIHMLHDVSPDALIIDIATGNEELALLQSLKSSERFQNIPVLASSKLDQGTSDANQCLLLADDHIVKPFISGECIVRLKRLLLNNRSSSPVMHKQENIIVVLERSKATRNSIEESLKNQPMLATLKLSDKPTLFWSQVQSGCDLILLDTGFVEEDPTLLGKLRREYSHIPIVFLATFKELSTDIARDKYRNSDMLIKPFMAKNLIGKIEKYVIQPPEADTAHPSFKSGSFVANPKHKRHKNKDLPEPVFLKGLHLSNPENIQQEKEKIIQQLNVSLNHEIRSPLTSILIGSQALKSKFPNGSDEQHIVKEIEESSNRIKEILDSLGNLKQLIVEDYISGIEMINFSKSTKTLAHHD